MAAKRERLVELVKLTTNNVDAIKQGEQLKDTVRKAIGKTMHDQGWKYRMPDVIHSSDTAGHAYTAKLTLVKEQERERSNSAETFETQLKDILAKLASFGRGHNWRLAGEQATAELTATVQGIEKQDIPDFKLPEDISQHFSHIYDRDAQIRVVYSAIQAAKSTGFHKRNHCLLWGKPACGKTEILLAFERLVGSDNVIKLDATMTTKAGWENLLLGLQSIPPFLILEEAEKVNPQYMTWLLGVMDQRGEIIKVNARTADEGGKRKEARCLVLATVNSIVEFNGVMSGALASRFQHKVFCPRPSREVLVKILTREIAKFGGKMEWINPAIDYAIEEATADAKAVGSSEVPLCDPRRVIAVLDGGDRLLDGSYQRDLLEIHQAMSKEASQG